MSHSRAAWTALGLAALSSVPVAGSAAGEISTRVAAFEERARVETVAPWDAASVQRLVRLDGRLHQEHAGFYYRVRADEITTRLADGVATWPELLRRVEVRDPALARQLSALTPLRRNALGVVDLRLPGGDPAYWAELVHASGLVRYAEISTDGVWCDLPPDDDLFPQQWALSNTGQTGGTPGADIGALAAWTISAGTPNVTVAVIDSGTALDHPDLAANVWINEDELPANGIDDDLNGFVDDWRGWDFGHGDGDPTSSSYHGTHVMGILNARGHNGAGIAGVAGGLGSPGVRGMALEVGELGPITSVIDDAILYAVDNGARVLTLSLTLAPSQAIADALSYAHDVRDALIVCATGNGGTSVGFPATHPAVVAVASTDHHDQRSAFSSSGPQVAVAAPGSNILSTQLAGSYGSASGTSFAAPHVAALAALIRGLRPQMTAEAVRQTIADTADDVGPPGFDVGTGHGRIDAFRALSAVASADGGIAWAEPEYGCTEIARVELSDADLAGGGPISIDVASAAEPEGESLTLVEVDFGSFTGAIRLAAGAARPDGDLQVGHGDEIRAIWVEGEGGAGGVTHVATAAVDCAGPWISSVAVDPIGERSATVRWITDEPSTSVVNYGDALPPESEQSDPTRVLFHAIELVGLDACTSYGFSVSSADAFGNVSTDDGIGLFHPFQTLGGTASTGVCEAGHLTLDAVSYGCDDRVEVTLSDAGLDTSQPTRNWAWVLLTSSTEPVGEWAFLLETGPSTAIFAGELPLVASASTTVDGRLSVSPGDWITATYQDLDGVGGKPHVVTAVARADCSPPVIENLRVVEVSETSASIEWSTDEPATSRVDFGASPALGRFVEDAALTIAHRVSLEGLTPCQHVWFRVTSADAHGDVAQSGIGGAPLAFDLGHAESLVLPGESAAQTGATSFEPLTPLEACAGCAGSPAFTGLVSAIDREPCARSGIELAWAQPAAWGTGSSGTFEIFRAASSTFQPNPSNRVASGVTGTSWIDLSVPPNVRVWYVVRARNDESCGPEGGLSDGNLVRRSAIDTLEQDPPAALEAVEAGLLGGVHVRLAWNAVPGAASYVVRRATSPDFSDAIDLVTTDERIYVDLFAGTNGRPFEVYRVTPLDACGGEPAADSAAEPTP